MMRKWLAVFVLLTLAQPPGAASAKVNLIDGANRVRAGCVAAADVVPPLVVSAVLDGVARAVTGGVSLEDAVAGAGYSARHLALLRVRTAAGPEAVLRVLADRYCETLGNAEFTEIGAHREGEETVLVVAAPLVMPELRADGAALVELARLVNGTRAEPRRCGRAELPAAVPLQRNALLDEAARGHAADLAARQVLSHQGSDGTRPADRVARVGYRWSAVAENVAAGQRDPAAALASWLESAGHCSNLMNARYSHTGLAVALSDTAAGGVYWVQVFAAPR